MAVMLSTATPQPERALRPGLGAVGRRPQLHAGKEGNMQMISSKGNSFSTQGAAAANCGRTV